MKKFVKIAPALGEVGVRRWGWGTYLGGENAWMGIGASEGGGFVCSFRKHTPTLLAEIIQ
jgi:hypothetical protein